MVCLWQATDRWSLKTGVPHHCVINRPTADRSRLPAEPIMHHVPGRCAPGTRACMREQATWLLQTVQRAPPLASIQHVARAMYTRNNLGGGDLPCTPGQFLLKQGGNLGEASRQRGSGGCRLLLWRRGLRTSPMLPTWRGDKSSSLRPYRSRVAVKAGGAHLREPAGDAEVVGANFDHAAFAPKARPRHARAAQRLCAHARTVLRLCHNAFEEHR